MGLFVHDRSDARIPVDIVTGFLGSGKTTLINHLMRSPELTDTAIIINEYGEVPLDQHLVPQGDEVVVLANGCLCCVMQGEFEEAVGRLYARREAEGIPEFKRLIVETTGLADPAPLVQVLLNNPLISGNFRLDRVITTVDAVNGLGAIADHAEAVKQVALADRLLITKRDLAEAAACDALTTRLAAINQFALVIDVANGVVAPPVLFGDGGSRAPGQEAEILRWLALPGAHADHHGHDRVAGIETFCLTIDHPIAWRVFADNMRRVRVAHADRLLRVKGLVNVEGEDAPIVVHGVHHVFHAPVRLDRWPTEDRRTRLVFITSGLGKQDVESLWYKEEPASRLEEWLNTVQ